VIFLRTCKKIIFSAIALMNGVVYYKENAKG
jgi:hypothetical protein